MSTFRDDAEHRDEPTNLTGHAVLDDHHNKVGTVSDVLYDERGSARWAVVDPGVRCGPRSSCPSRAPTSPRAVRW